MPFSLGNCPWFAKLGRKLARALCLSLHPVSPHALHARCRIIIAASVAAARADLAHAPTRERAVRSARLRKLEKLEAYALVLG